MTTTTPVAQSTATTSTARSLLKTGALAGVIASAFTFAIAVAARAVDVPLAVGGEAIPVIGVAQVTFFFSLIGIGIAAAIARWASRPQRTFVVVTVALTVLSFASPFTAEADAATRVVLELTHVAAAAVVIPMLAAQLRRNNQR